MKYRDFKAIIEENGFSLIREKATHKQFYKKIGDKSFLVTLDYSHLGEDISPRNLNSMIRQSGLPKKLFR